MDTFQKIREALLAVAGGPRPWPWDLFIRLMRERSPVHPRRSSLYDFLALHDVVVTGIITEDAVIIAEIWLPGERP